MATEIESILRAWCAVTGPFPTTGAGFTFKGDGVESVERTSQGTFLITLSDAYDSSNTLLLGTVSPGQNIQNPAEPGPQTLNCAVISQTEVEVIIYDGLDPNVSNRLDPQGFSFEVMVANVEAADRAAI